MAALSVSNLFSLYSVFSRFSFKSGICLLIAPVPVHCFSITFRRNGETISNENVKLHFAV